MSQPAAKPLIPLVLTRPTRASLEFWGSLPDQIKAQVEPVIAPLLTIAPVAQDDALAAADAVVFSSSNGVLHGPKGDGRVAFCVGTRTAATASLSGWQGICAGQNADELVETLSTQSDRPSLLHISGQHTRGDIVGRLSDADYTIRHAIVYDQHPEALTSAAVKVLSNGAPCVIPVFSPRTAAHLAASAPHLADAHIIAMSRPIAMSLADQTCASLMIAEAPTAEAMRTAIAAALRTIGSG